jgi:hypothetical protein
MKLVYLRFKNAARFFCMCVAAQWEYQYTKAKLVRARVKVWQMLRAERRDRILNPDKYRLENPS